MRRILQIVAAGYPGGGTNHVLQIVRGLGESFEFGLVSQAGSYLLHEAACEGVPCFGLNFFSSRFDPRIPLRLRSIIAEFRPNLVHVHGGRAGLFHAFALTDRATVYSVHGLPFVHKPVILQWLAALGERVAMKRADCVIFESQYDRALAGAYRALPGGHRCTVIHNGIVLGDGLGPMETDPCRIGFIGRLEYQKDPMLFLDMLPYLEGGYEVVMVGGGSLETAVAQEVKRKGLTERVRLLGTLSHQETLEVLRTLGVVVMTSRWEGLPLLPLEAMWLGIPVIATNVGGLNEIIENGKSGMLVNSRSATELAAAVQLLTKSMELRRSVVANARERIRSLFTEKRMLGDIRNVYERSFIVSV